MYFFFKHIDFCAVIGEVQYWFKSRGHFAHSRKLLRTSPRRHTILVCRWCFIRKRAKSGLSRCPIHLKIVLVFSTVRRELFCLGYVTFSDYIYFIFCFNLISAILLNRVCEIFVLCLFFCLNCASLLSIYVGDGQTEYVPTALAINKIKIKVFGQVRVDQLITYLLYYSSVIQNIFRY